MDWLPKAKVASGAMVTDSPRVTTTLMSGDDNRRNWNSTKYRNTPSSRPGHDDRDQGRRDDAPVMLGVEVVVEAGDEVGERAEREVQDASRQVGHHQAGRGDGVDTSQYQPGDHILQQSVVPRVLGRSRPHQSPLLYRNRGEQGSQSLASDRRAPWDTFSPLPTGPRGARVPEAMSITDEVPTI